MGSALVKVKPFNFVLLLGLTIVALYLDWRAALGVVQQVQWLRHPTATATVMAIDLGAYTYRGRGSTVLHGSHPQITYRYQVDGILFEGHRFRLGASTTRNEEFVEAHPVGQTVSISYDPAAPGESLLHPGFQGTDIVQLVYLIPLNLVTLHAWWWAYILWTPWSDYRVIRRGTRRRVIANQIPLGSSLATLASVALAMLIWVVQVFDNLPMGWALGAVALVLAPFLWLARNRLARPPQAALTLDEQTGRLSFCPLADQPAGQPEEYLPLHDLPCASLLGLRIQSLTKERTVYFWVRLVYSEHGEEKSVRLMACSSEESAHSLLDLLRSLLHLPEVPYLPPSRPAADSQAEGWLDS